MQKIKKHFQYALLAVVTMFTMSLASPLVAPAMAASNNCKDTVLTFPAWYKGVNDKTPACNLQIDNLNDIWVIVMNGIEILLQVVAYVSIGFIIWGGFKYIKSEGDPGKISEAKMAIINAIIGLVIALISVALVQFVQGNVIQS